ncbi:restriction endonuclease [Companilactobacillus jidongensis]|uniref:restriction endonuclease n=1 Tax=Companilactobacillus jidongensis TaxID=2486006 RepID=UPI000F7B25BA|nr:restriction endonuclease [Companilactobacillus jidongensis]
MDFDYRDMKLGKHGLPTWDAMIPVLLDLTSDGKEHTGKNLKKRASDSVGLPEELRNATYDSSYMDNLIENRASWGLSEGYTDGIFERPSRGIYIISDLGKQILKNKTVLTVEFLHSLPKYQEHKNELKERNERNNINSDDKVPESFEDISENISTTVTSYNNQVASDLLSRIQASDPRFFENLVVKLLVAMGYRGPNGNSKVTQSTNDGGIDGVINQDALGTNTIYIQAKRYNSDNVVQRPMIDAFFGSLSRIHADRGVFITTSSFSKNAIETAKGFSIVLTELMLQYHVGIQIKNSFELFEIDEDFFEN